MMINMTDIVFATRNAGKMREIKGCFQGTKYRILSLDDIGVNIEVVEDGATFEANAAKKAREICRAAGLLTLADDSGLEIDWLAGEPGVDSANFLGADTPYAVRCAKILDMLADAPNHKRGARFVCVIAIARPGCDDIITVRGMLEGEIARTITGGGGFGYDPIFYVPECGKTTAQLDVAEKNRISHRGQALKLAMEALDKL